MVIGAGAGRFASASSIDPQRDISVVNVFING